MSCRKVSRRVASGKGQLTILDSVDLDIPQHAAVAIEGPSGSGKSTLLALLAGLERPSEGSILVEGTAIEGLDEDALADLRRTKIGFVFQSFQLLANLTARENILLPLELSRVADARERTHALLARVGLAERAEHYPAQLSGGEQQRVAVARAFATQPRILLADEPTGNLDQRTGEHVLELLLTLRREHGTTLVIVTHDARIAERLDLPRHAQDRARDALAGRQRVRADRDPR